MRRALMLAIAVCALFAGGVGIALASIPDSGGVIHGCYKTSNPGQGALIIIDSASQSCPSGTTSLNWSQTGPQGPAGPQGPSGPISVHVVESGQSGYPFSTVDPGQVNQLSLPCDPGQIAIAGNWFVNGNGDAAGFPQLSVQSSGPVFPADQGWNVSVRNSGSSPATFGIHVLCATGTEH